LIYLPVGHTHEKVDRDLFAPVGARKKLKNCQTPEKFPKFVKKAFRNTRTKPTFNSSPFFWDWKTFFSGSTRSIKNITNFRAFRFTLNSLDAPTLFYKKTILDASWLGFEASLTQGIC
jgi:hypothetical protein